MPHPLEQFPLQAPGADPLVFDLDQLPRTTVPGLYIHVPFCFHKCHYCDFYSITRQTPQRMERFVDLVLQEAQAWTRPGRPGVRPRTIFMGGGTPSLLPFPAMQKLLAGIGERFDLSELEEWTVECNPATVSLEYCSMLRQMGVDRISLGAQSFNTQELAMLQRHHDPADVPRSIQIAQEAGFKRLNVDLIFAIPGQDLLSWRHSLEQAVALETEHLSCYALTYEPNTPMAVKKRLGTVRAAEEKVELDMLHCARERLGMAGFRAYEISNFAQPGRECRHNLLYWNGGSYIGLGPSAASHVEGWRWKNRGHLGEWETAVEAGGLPAAEAERLSAQQRAGELAMLQLRLAGGVAFDDFLERTGLDAQQAYARPLAELAKLGLLEVDEVGFRLTARKGIEVADAVAAEFLIV